MSSDEFQKRAACSLRLRQMRTAEESGHVGPPTAQQSRTATEGTPLVAPGTSTTAAHPKALQRLYINSRDSWSALMVGLLFLGKGSIPFLNDILKSVQTSRT